MCTTCAEYPLDLPVADYDFLPLSATKAYYQDWHDKSSNHVVSLDHAPIIHSTKTWLMHAAIGAI